MIKHLSDRPRRRPRARSRKFKSPITQNPQPESLLLASGHWLPVIVYRLLASSQQRAASGRTIEILNLRILLAAPKPFRRRREPFRPPTQTHRKNIA
jgi:hypothetical protein